MIPKTSLRFVAAAALLIAVLIEPARAQDTNTFERVLVPISVGQVPGAYGSVWSTELWYRNNSARPVSIFPLAITDFVPTIGRTESLPVGNMPPATPGQILYLDRDGGSQVQFDLRLFNRAAPQDAWGTKLPVVRENEFVQAVSLINVPTGPAFRSALRIYALPDTPAIGETARIQIYSFDERLLASAELPLEGVPPYAAILSLADAFPAIGEVPRVRVQVETRSGQSKIWAFVSVVSNRTQEVALVTPD